MRCTGCGMEFTPQDEVYAMLSGDWLCHDCYIRQEGTTGTQMAIPDMVYNVISRFKHLDDAREMTLHD